jgi:hypothetical protein
VGIVIVMGDAFGMVPGNAHRCVVGRWVRQWRPVVVGAMWLQQAGVGDA